MSYYPDNVNPNSKDCPWNQNDDDYWCMDKEDAICEHCDKEEVEVDKNNICEKCFYDMQESW